MSRSAANTVLLIFASLGFACPSVGRAEPKTVTLPMIEVPDHLKTQKKPSPEVERAALLGRPIELTNLDDRRTLAREQSAWRRLSGSLCLGCVDRQPLSRVGFVDPVAVLNAKPTSWRTTAEVSPPVAQTHVHRVRLAHRHVRRSRLFAYYSRVRYALFRWRRHHHHHHRTRLVQR